MLVALFPYSLVLFPGIPLPLRFFEARYKEMAGDVVAGTGDFGVVMATQESSFGNEVPVSIGTLAHVVENVRLPDGQWLFQTVGTRRFRINEVGARVPYLTASVDLLEEKDGNDLRAEALRDSLTLKMRRLFALRTEAGLESVPVTAEFDFDPGRASYQIAALLGLSLRTAQRVLEVEAADDRLAVEVALVDEAVAQAERLVRGEGRVSPP
jgi:Lon protease-like protein